MKDWIINVPVGERVFLSMLEITNKFKNKWPDFGLMSGGIMEGENEGSEKVGEIPTMEGGI